MSDWLADLTALAGAFAAASGIAALAGAVNAGTALAFGQIAFTLVLVYVLVRRKPRPASLALPPRRRR